MKELIKKGFYSIVETSKSTKMLILDDAACFIWIYAEGIGEILVMSRNRQKISKILSIGKYNVYQVEDDPKFTDLPHLELEVGNGRWQGYLLPNGLPTMKKRKHMIIPTNQLIHKTRHSSVFDSMIERFQIISNKRKRVNINHL